MARAEQTAIIKEVVEDINGLIHMAESLDTSISFFKH